MSATATESEFQIIASNVVLAQPVALPITGFGRPTDDPQMAGEYAHGEIARLSTGQLWGRSTDRRFAPIDPTTMRAAATFSNRANWHNWYQATVARFRDGVMRFELEPPARDADSTEFSAFRAQWPQLWSRLSQALDIKIVEATAPKFDPGPINRVKYSHGMPFALMNPIEHIQRHLYMGDFGEFGTFDPTPPTHEEMWLFGSDLLSIARSNSLAIMLRAYPIRSKYERGVSVITIPGPMTLIYTESTW